jgi:NADPH2:quinone reductase
VLVLGAAGGVGLAAVQVAQAAGATVIAAAGSPERLELCRAAGAEVLVDYTRDDLKEAVRAATGGRGADIVVDVVGGAYTEAALRATAWRGRVLVIGFAAGDIPRIPANLLLLKGCEASGVFWDEFLRREPEAAAAQVAAILAGFADGRLQPRITGRYPLARASDALFALARRAAPGKLIVTPITPA